MVENTGLSAVLVQIADLDTAQDQYFSRLMFISAMYKFVLNLFIYYLIYIFFLPARAAASSTTCICASGWFVRMENNNGTPDTSNYV